MRTRIVALLVLASLVAASCGTDSSAAGDEDRADITVFAAASLTAAFTELGEADAGIVYRTDVLATGDDVVGVAIPAEINVVAEYPMALVVDASNPDGGRAFVDFVLGPTGQRVLADAGFGPP